MRYHWEDTVSPIIVKRRLLKDCKPTIACVLSRLSLWEKYGVAWLNSVHVEDEWGVPPIIDSMDYDDWEIYENMLEDNEEFLIGDDEE